jgi:hypothetical protein
MFGVRRLPLRIAAVIVSRERFERLRSVEFFGVLRCAQDDGKSKNAALRIAGKSMTEP